jgi:uncharacterized protein
MTRLVHGATCRLRARTLARAVLLVCLCAAPARAATSPETPLPPYIEVTGEAEARVAPDTAQLDFGVMTRADTAAVAVQQNAARMKAVLAAIRQALGSEGQIGTGNYSLRAEYTSPRDGTPPRVTGYTASNVVRLETRELARVGELIDIAAQAGSNQVQRIAFTLRDPSASRRRALSDAVLDAQGEAETIAAALKVRLGPVHSVIEHESGPIRPFMQEAVMARADAATTPIEPGTVSVRARVLLRVQISR